MARKPANKTKVTRLDNNDINLVLALRDRGASFEHIAKIFNVTESTIRRRVIEYSLPTEEVLKNRSTKDVLNKVIDVLDQTEDHITMNFKKVMHKLCEWYINFIDNNNVILNKIDQLDNLEDKVRMMSGMKVSMADVITSLKQTTVLSAPVQNINNNIEEQAHEKIALYLPKNARFHE